MPVKSSHVADPILAPFLRADFDPAEYLNYTLPALTSPSSLASLSSETQTLLATLNAQATRLTQTLTQLTDEILRSGSRLAYQVDVLRGESTTLNESLNERLKDDIAIFAPPENKDGTNGLTNNRTTAVNSHDNDTYPGLPTSEPTHIARLRLLSDVRTRLDAVIQLFGAAIAWPAPPSSSGGSFISVSAPPASEADEKAKVHAESLKNDLLASISSGDDKTALAKIDELKELLGIWKGTAEEKSREKLVTDLSNLVEENIREQRDSALNSTSRRKLGWNVGSRPRGSSKSQQDQQQYQVPHTGPFLDGLI